MRTGLVKLVMTAARSLPASFYTILCRSSLRRDGLAELATNSGYTLARYNDPSTPAPFRRNEVMVPLSGYELW